MAKTLMEETCETTTLVKDKAMPLRFGANPRLMKCGELAVIEALHPVPAFLCLSCASVIYSRDGLTWRRLPRARKWRTDDPMDGTHL